MWTRYFYQVTETAILYYEKKYDLGTFVGFVDRALVKGIESLGEALGDGGRKLYTAKIDVGGAYHWTLASAKAQTRAALCMELEPLSEQGSFTPTSFQIRKAKKGPRSPVPFAGSPSSANSTSSPRKTNKIDARQFLIRTLSHYEGEWDKSGNKETETARSKKLAGVMEQLVEDDKLLTIKGGSIFDELEALIDDMIAHDEEPLVIQTIRGTIGRYSAKTQRNATMSVGALRANVIATISSRNQRGPSSVTDLWSPSPDIPAAGTLELNSALASQMLAKLGGDDEDEEEEEEEQDNDD